METDALTPSAEELIDEIGAAFQKQTQPPKDSFTLADFKALSDAHAAALAQGLEPGAIMLDATLNRINRAAAEMGYSRIVMLNAYPFRATTPEGLWEWEERSGFMMRDYIAELDKVLEEIKPAVIVAAWGSSMPQTQQARAAHAGRMALLKLALNRHAPLKCWGVLGHGAPAHPLRLSAERLRQLDSFGA
jgi:hypothetical protein